MAALEALSSMENMKSPLASDRAQIMVGGASLAARRRRMEEQRAKFQSAGSTIAEHLDKKLRQSTSAIDSDDEEVFDSMQDTFPPGSVETKTGESREADHCNGLSQSVESMEQSGNGDAQNPAEASQQLPASDPEADAEPEHSEMRSGSSMDASVGASKASGPSHGFHALCGRRREMEDAVALFPSFISVPCGSPFGCQVAGCEGESCDLHFFGVYDGHGGYQAAEYCAKNMHSALAAQIRYLLQSKSATSAATSDSSASSDPHASWRAAVAHSFLRMDADVSGSYLPPYADLGAGGADVSSSQLTGAPPLAPETVGSTSVVAIVSRNLIVVGNAGDSRAILGTKRGGARALSNDHKPDREDEMRRVESAGGRVIFWNGYRVLGVLAMSRAIGDRYLKPYVIPEPEFTFTERSEDDEFLILGSDGLWDVVSNEMACDVARRCLAAKKQGLRMTEFPFDVDGVQGTPSTVAATVLAKIALARGSSDNVSVVVVDLSES